MRGAPIIGARLLPCVIALALVPAAHAETLYTNLDGGASSNGWETTQTQWLAQQFTATKAGTARLASFWATAYLNQTTSVSVSLYTNSTANGGQPGTPIAVGAPATIGDSTGAAPTCTTLSGVSGQPLPALTAGQKYWAVMRAHASNTGIWRYAGQGPRMVSTNSGATWTAPTPGTSGATFSFSVRVDDGASCAPDIATNPVAGIELGDMYAKPSGTAFQTLFVTNTGIAPLNLTGGTFSGPSASTFKLLNGEPEGRPPGSAFTFPKTIGTSNGTGGVFMYVVCAPPAGTADGQKVATFTVTSNDPDEGSLSWPVWCLVDTTPPSLEFIQSPDGRNGWFVTSPAPLQVRGIDPESGDRVKRIFCSDNGASTLDWPNGSFASFSIGPEGTHAISCQGTDVANNTSAPGAFTTSVKIDVTPPETTKGDGPSGTSDQTAFTFSFGGTDALSGVGNHECRLDGGPYTPCTSPATRSGLGNAPHTFDVRTVDVAGNPDPTPVRWEWTVNAPPPQAADDTASGTADTPLEIDVLANDVEPRGGTLAPVLSAAATDQGGTVSVSGSKVRYVPAAGFVGTDRFTYQAVNGNGVMSSVANVTIDVRAAEVRPADLAPAEITGQSNPLVVAVPARATALGLRPAVFRAAGRRAGAAATRKQPRVGSTVRFELDRSSLVTFTVQRALPGKRRGKACVGAGKAPRRARACTRFVAVKGSLTRTGNAGPNAFRFTGRLSGRALRAGRYRLIATPAAAGGTQAIAVSARFRISR